MTDPTPLSPGAQKVLDATSGTFGNYQFTARGQMIAAALRAVADQVAPYDELGPVKWDAEDEIRANLLAIAAELEGAQ